MGTISCSETLVENYQSTLRIIPQGRRFHLAIICVPKLSVLRQWPTWCTLALFYNTSTTILYMFRTLHAHHQETELYWCSIWYRPLSQWPSGAQIDRELVQPVFSQPVYRTATDWDDDTRCCINTIRPPDDEHVMLETCRGLEWTYCKIKQVCIKLVIVQAYTKMHGQQNIKKVDMKCRIGCSRVITYTRCTMKATWVGVTSVIKIRSRILHGWKRK